jgi:hypothetical protein
VRSAKAGERGEREKRRKGEAAKEEDGVGHGGLQPENDGHVLSGEASYHGKRR